MTVTEPDTGACSQDEVVRVVHDTLDAVAEQDGVLLLVQDGGKDQVELVYDERVVTVTLDDLARRDGEDARTSLSEKILSWYRNRPPCDAEAAARGVVGLAEDGDEFVWEVFVPRVTGRVPWTPSSWLTTEEVAQIRSACRWRAGVVVAAPILRGTTAIWRAIPDEACTAVLTDTDRMVQQMRLLGLPALDPCAVVSSTGTVVATERMAAHRLAEQISAPLVRVIPLNEPIPFRWR